MHKKIMLIDGNSLLFRAFHALPPLSNKDGIMTNAVFGFVNMLLKLIEDYKPNFMAVAFDTAAPTFRHKEYAEYKATRTELPEGLGHQFGLVKNLLKLMDIMALELEGFEADDILGTLSCKAQNEETEALIVTGDKDCLQLISPKVSVLITKKGISQSQIFDENELINVYGIKPWQIIELKSLMGDNSDNIPGVPGIGEKTALSLLKQFESLNGIYENIELVKGLKTRESLVNNKEIAFFSKMLATIIRDVPIKVDFTDCTLNLKLTQDLSQQLDWLGFQAVKNKILQISDDNKENVRQELPKVIKEYLEINNNKELNDLLQKIERDALVALLFSDKLTIAAPSLPVCLLNVPLEDCLESIKPMLEDHRIKKVTFDIKSLMHYCSKFGISPEGFVFDVYIAAYILNPSEQNYDLKQLVYDYLKFDADSPDAEDILKLESIMRQELKNHNLENLYEKIEHPLIEVLFEMENRGFKVDGEALALLGVEFKAIQNSLTEKIYEISQVRFNINSPKQLGEVLFEKLNLPHIKKTKTGYSTDIEVLEQLSGKHPIISEIIDYRQISKLNSTYIDGLGKMIEHSDGKIHTKFNQTIAVTGRISSTDPNLQNIPVRMETGRRIRKVFVASTNHILVDADYSQIELRILAHISGDLAFVDAFNSGEDIHRKTAAEIFDVEISDVTNEQRNSAKAVNFGIIYGISDFGLSRNLGISPAVAKTYISNYFDRYPQVKKYLDEVVRQAETDGYVTTLMGRKRNIPEIRSRNKTIQAFGRRLAMNTPIQGTAADIIKKAMIDVHNELILRKLRSKLILQVHDELIVDTALSELEEVKCLLLDKMSNTVALKVPLLVEIGTGVNWYDAK